MPENLNVMIDYKNLTPITLHIGGPRGEQGEKGDQGGQGIQGETGDQGDQGIQGETGETGAVPNITIGDTTTLAAGSNATVTRRGIDTAPIFDFGIPRGADGTASEVLSATINTTWAGYNAPYTKTQPISGLLATDTPIVDIVMSGTYSTDKARSEAWSKIYRITTANDSMTLYADEKPTVSLPIQLKVVR